MKDLLKTIAVVLLGVGVFALILLTLYWVTNQLPKRFRESSQVVVFLGPALLLVLIGLVVPAIRTIVLSLYSDGREEKFQWLDNYTDIFGDSAMRTVLFNNFLWVVLVTSLSAYFGLRIARFADGMRGENVAKALIFLPTAISFVGAGIIWKFIYAPRIGRGEDIGLLNRVWTWLDPILPGKQDSQLWLLKTDFKLNTLLLIVVMIWIQTGFATVVFSAAIKGVPDTLREAARIDGASERQIFRRVVVPFIRPTIITVLTTTVIAVLKVFDIVRAMTGGNFETNVIANEMYAKSFPQDRPNYGAALAVILFIAVLPIVFVNQRNQRYAREIS
jgi:alpha-glucoside transport system permease protein